MLLPSCQLSLGYFQCFSQHHQFWVVILISQTHIDQVAKPSVRDWDKARKRSDSGPTKICVGKEKVDSNFDSQARLNLIKDPDAKSGPFVQLGQQPKVETPITVTTSSSSSFTSTQQQQWYHPHKPRYIYVMVHLHNWLLCIITGFYT